MSIIPTYGWEMDSQRDERTYPVNQIGQQCHNSTLMLATSASVCELTSCEVCLIIGMAKGS